MEAGEILLKRGLLDRRQLELSRNAQAKSESVRLDEAAVGLGFVTEEAALRANALTDAEVAQIYQRIDEAPAGGASVLLIALVIFAVLELTGYINVIPDK